MVDITNMQNWFKLDESRNREDQVRYNIAIAVEGYLNGCYDDDYKPMTQGEWVAYVYKIMQEEFTFNGCTTRGAQHLHFVGRQKTIALIQGFLSGYKDVQPYIKQ